MKYTYNIIYLLVLTNLLTTFDKAEEEEIIWSHLHDDRQTASENVRQ